MLSRTPVRLVVGALTGVLAMIGMIRLASGGFENGLSPLAWTMILLAMVPWVAYVTWRAGRGHLSARGVLAVIGIDLLGLVVVWLFTAGPVLALACSLAAFVLIWINDWPVRQPRGEERFVRFDELQDEDDDT